MQTPQPVATPVSVPATKITGTQAQALVSEWREVQEQKALLVEKERELRLMIVEQTDFFTPTKEKGTENYSFNGAWSGWKLKCTKKINWCTATEADGVPIQQALEEIKESAGAMAAEELIKFKPEVKISIYDKLTEEEKQIIDPFLTYSPGTPELKLVEPKS